ncbi:hypothetical protein CIK05_00830 [Bdellovibrio sp. qaytius]|nr:hypothetical protein CIK05_00830 [Bdellovibrio sp. qaytius]
MFKAFILTMVLGLSAQAQVWDAAVDAVTLPPDFSAREFNEADFQNYPWLKEFKLVVVINKANTGNDRQTLRVYENQKVILLTKISSGRETYEKGCGPGQEPKKDHCSQRAYWSTTPVGYFDVDTLDENYFSNLWQTWMPYAVFFESGIATHQAPAGTEGKLGGRASGGCVRMHPNMAPVLFSYVQKAGKGLVPKVNRDGSVAQTKQGDTVRWQGYKTLYIVQNVVK